MTASRYRTDTGAEGEFEPGSSGEVLHNKLAINEKEEMDRAEFEALVRVQENWLEKVTEETRFTAALICDMHRDWLGGIYDWAGSYRTVELQKGSFKWPPAYKTAENMATFERGMLRELTPCRPGQLPDVALAVSKVHAELLLIHPFREGNGRLARWLADLMFLQAGYPIPDYEFSGSREGEAEKYLAAVTQGYIGRYQALTGFFVDAVTRALDDAKEER